MDIATALSRLRQSLNTTAPDPRYEGLVAGSADMTVSRIATCNAPSVRLLRRIAESGCNLVISDGHPFYTHDPAWGAANVREIVDASPVGIAKQKLIDTLGLAVIRLPSAYANRFPAQAALAFADAWGIDSVHPAPDSADFAIADVQPEDFEPLARRLATRNGCGGMRLIGRPDRRVRRMAIGTGLLYPADIARMLDDQTVDTVIGGDVVEWEGAPYFEDVIASGRDAGLILTGQAASREPMSRALQKWVRETLPDADVVAFQDSDPVWSVDRKEAQA